MSAPRRSRTAPSAIASDTGEPTEAIWTLGPIAVTRDHARCGGFVEQAMHGYPQWRGTAIDGTCVCQRQPANAEIGQLGRDFHVDSADAEQQDVRGPQPLDHVVCGCLKCRVPRKEHGHAVDGIDVTSAAHPAAVDEQPVPIEHVEEPLDRVQRRAGRPRQLGRRTAAGAQQIEHQLDGAIAIVEAQLLACFVYESQLDTMPAPEDVLQARMHAALPRSATVGTVGRRTRESRVACPRRVTQANIAAKVSPQKHRHKKVRRAPNLSRRAATAAYLRSRACR
jgi:hypothetical protein